MWSIDLVRRAGFIRSRRHERGRGQASPILLIDTVGTQQRIAHCCERAASVGVVPGMSLAHARALLPWQGVVVQEHDRALEQRRLKALAMWAMRFTPVVSPDPPDGLVLDVTGCSRLHRGERRMLNAIANSLEWLGFGVRVAGASSFACARALARYGDDRSLIQAGDELDALRELPMEALRLNDQTLEALHEVNLTHIGELARLPRADLATRFGRHLLLRLDQALGDAEESIDPQQEIFVPRVERAFEGPVRNIEGIAITVRELIAELCSELQRHESGVRRLDIDFERVDAENLRETIMLSRPSRDARHLWNLLRPRVEKIHLGFGVERVAMHATRSARLRHAQVKHWNSDAGDPQIACAAGELIDTLTNRMGRERVSRALLTASHVPERASHFEPALECRPQAAGADREQHARHMTGDRPTVLFERPEAVDVISMAPEGPPKWLRWRHGEHIICSCIGPERVDEEWWHERAPRQSQTRDYFRVQLDDGRWLWMFRIDTEGQSHSQTRECWFVHGEWT